MSVLVEIAEAIRHEIQTNDWGRQICVRRTYSDWRIRLEDTSDLAIDVVPWDDRVELISRGKLKYACEVDVLIRKRLTINEQDVDGKLLRDEIDSLMTLSQDVFEFFAPSQTLQNGRQLTQVQDAHWLDDSRVMKRYFRPHIAELRQFTSWLRIVYGKHKQVV